MFGSLAWAQQRDGRLSAGEKAAELARGAYALAVSRAARVGAFMGLRPREVSLALRDVVMPETALTKAALEFMHDAPRWVMAHSMRTYVFGSLLSLRDGLQADPEVSFIASQLHDVGLVRREGCACFAQRGAEAAYALLLERGAPQLATQVADCIAMHLNVGVEGSPEARLLRTGAAYDVVAERLAEVPAVLRAEIFAQWPREAMAQQLDAVMRDEVRQHRGTRLDFLVRTLGFLGLVRDAERRLSQIGPK